ncbi:MAG TPA: cysteine dioxygenase family protein [Candidatus Limnocylindria bacterium]|nr:cysteine dioxygenase family protein [Candidatus Limnocylindria bacterium]
MAVTPHSAKVGELIRRLDEAVATANDDATRCRNVKRVLTEVVSSGQDFVDALFLKPAPNRYARRLLHRDPQGRYTALVMVWDRGQGTPLHDHAGHWCVECVYRGRIQVTSYSVRGGDPERGVVQFEKETVVMAGVGEAGALIPPFEYHVLENPDESPAITIHVYGEELTFCHVFDPVEGGYQRVYRELQYTDVTPQM